MNVSAISRMNTFYETFSKNYTIGHWPQFHLMNSPWVKMYEDTEKTISMIFFITATATETSPN